MPAWLWMAVVTIVGSWLAFLYALTRRHWNLTSLIAGAFHMLFAATVSFAPFRSWLDPNYLGLSLGFLRFEGRGASLPCGLILAWALASALVVVSMDRSRWMILVLAGDVFWALNFGGALLRGDAMQSRIQLGETATFTGAWALLILFSFFVVPFVLSAIWCVQHLRDAGSYQALATKVGE